MVRHRNLRNGLTALLALILLIATGCSAGSTPAQAPVADKGSSQAAVESKPAATTGGSAQPAKARKTVYFATFAIGNAFWGLMEQGAKDAANALGVKVVWTQGQEFSVEQTVNRMETAIAAKPDVLVVTDIDPRAMEPVMLKARQAGIPVIDINAPSPSATPPYMLYIGSNEYLSGRKAADAVLSAGPAPKRAVCAIQVLGHAALEARCKGYTDVLTDKGVTVDKVDVSGGPTQAEEKTKAYFISHPDAGAIYTLTAGPEAFDPVLKVLRDQKLTSKVRFVTNDTSPAAFQAIKAGDVVAAIDQQPYLQGYFAVQWAHLYLNFGMLPGGDVLTGPVLVTKDNVDLVTDLVKQGYR